MSTKINTKLTWKSAIILTVATALAAISNTDSARSFMTKSQLVATSTQFTYRNPAAVAPNRQQQRIIGIYQGRFELTANASEQEIRNRVRHFRARGFNTLVQGVWGNGCGMYASAVTKKLVGTARCPNEFNDRAVGWTIDEAHKQGMQFHAYFEKGIKIDKDSPIFSLAVRRKWLLAGVDNSDPQHSYYLLDVANPEVAAFYRSTVTEFVRKYPQVDAVQFDDYPTALEALQAAIDCASSPNANARTPQSQQHGESLTIVAVSPLAVAASQTSGSKKPTKSITWLVSTFAVLGSCTWIGSKIFNLRAAAPPQSTASEAIMTPIPNVEVKPSHKLSPLKEETGKVVKESPQHNRGVHHKPAARRVEPRQMW